MMFRCGRVGLLLGWAGCAPPQPGDGPNVLVILIDDIGVDAMSAANVVDDGPRTPTLDRLAAEGVRFTRAYSYSTCSPARAALLTGRHARRTGIGANVPQDPRGVSLGLDEVTMAEVAREAGYRTGVFGKWHLSDIGDGAATHALDQGFDTFVGTISNLATSVDDRARTLDYGRWEEVKDGRRRLRRGYATTATIDNALGWILDDDPRPWLAYVPLHGAHIPRHVPPRRLRSGPVDDTDRRAMFRAMVEATDQEIGRLLDELGSGWLENTLVVVAGDNGSVEEHFPDGYAPLGAKTTVYEGGIRVPFVVWGSPVVAPGTVDDRLVHVVDVLPTVADWIGADPSAYAWDGESLIPYVGGGDVEARDTVYVEQFRPVGFGPYDVDVRAVVGRTHKLIRRLPEDEEEFTEVAGSPGEERVIPADEATEDERAIRATLSAALDAIADGWDASAE